MIKRIVSMMNAYVQVVRDPVMDAFEIVVLMVGIEASFSAVVGAGFKVLGPDTIGDIDIARRCTGMKGGRGQARGKDEGFSHGLRSGIFIY